MSGELRVSLYVCDKFANWAIRTKTPRQRRDVLPVLRVCGVREHLKFSDEKIVAHLLASCLALLALASTVVASRE